MAGGDALVEGGGVIKAAPFVGDALIDFARDPPAGAVERCAMADVGGVDGDAIGVGAVEDVASEGLPGMRNVGLGDGEGFRGSDLGGGGGVARD